MNFNINQKGQKSDRDESMKKLLKSPAVMASGQYLCQKILMNFVIKRNY